ncbi:MAG: asparagine synthase (glutamine-hydrolyzing) [Clostridia bacterium]|nr:asparagine synthase (glutamine-hydrolyzing) [Clostridia bacterium]
MCGIAGWIDYGKSIAPDYHIVEDMSRAIKHRGPDDEGIFVSDNAVFGQRRLVVVDPEGGKQPMTVTVKGETFTLVYNGELYNTEDIRQTLYEKGHTFWGHSDTEVLLKAYAEWGEACLDRLNGIYAFAIWEHNAKTLFLARDRIGVKPLFFYRLKNGLLFASEIKALILHPEVDHTIDNDGIKQILLLGPGRSQGTGCIKGVKELKPGEKLKMRGNVCAISSYWRIRAQEHTDDLARTVERTRELIYNAVERQLVSDVPLACFLSGGLDSSIISKIASDYYRSKNQILTTYSVDYEDNEKYFESSSFQPDADSKYIGIMSSAIGSNHINVVLDNQEVAQSIIDATYARDLPGMGDVDSSLMLFSKKVKENHTVCLSGECADEIFAGYPWYHREELLYSDTFPWSKSLDMRKKLFNPSILGGGCEEFVDNEYKKTVNSADYLSTDDKQNRRVREMFMLNFYWFMQTLIDRKDRMTSSVGLEARVPLCDHRLVEYAYNMPWEFKALNGREKGIVREAFKGILPDEIVLRKKSPYPKSFNPIFINHVKSEATKLVYDKKSALYELVNKEYFEELASGKVNPANPWYGQLMRVPQIFAYLIQIDAFFKKFNLSII